jgi:hypothetical protein
MRQTVRTTLLFVATVFMGFSAFVNAIVSVPHLREDMEEINVRSTLLGAVMLGLRFGTVAMFALTFIVLAAAIRSLRATAIERIPLSIIAVAYFGFGVAAFITTRSHHTLGYVLIGILIAAATAIPNPREP